MKRRFGSFVVACAVALAATLPVMAGALDDRVPADSLVYVGWTGADALAPQYSASNLKQIIEASSVGEFLNKQLPLLITQATHDDAEAAKKIATLQQALQIAWQHPVAFYFCPVDFANPRKPSFRFGLLCDAGADAKKLNDLLTPAVEHISPEADLPVHVVQENTMVLLSFGKSDAIADLKAGGALSTAPAYTKAMAHVQQPGQAIAFYGDVQKVLQMVNDGINKSDAPPEVRTRVPATIAALGLNSLTQVAMLSGFDGKNWSERSFAGIDGPRNGLLTFFDTAPIPDELLAVVPKDAAAFSASRLDLQKVWAEARKVITIIEPKALPEIDKQIANANRELGVNIENDIINAMGDQWVMYRAPVGESGLSMTLINKARDEQSLAKAMDTLEKLFNEKSEMPFKIEKVKAGKMEVSALMFMQYNVAWTVRNGYLYVSTLNGIGPAVTQVESKQPSILTSDLYKGVMASLAPAGAKPTMIAYSHPARLYPELRNLVLGILPLIRAQGHIDVPMDLLPDPAQVSQYMTPGGTVTWSDADGLHGVERTAFPGAVLLGQGPNATTAVVGVGGVAAARLALMHSAAPQQAKVGLP